MKNKFKIMIADDNKNIGDILINYCNKEDYEPHFATDGAMAWKLFNEIDFDIVILDIMMPFMDGLTLSKRIREISDVPIIFLTAKGEEYDKIMGLDSGADDYIVKPFSPLEVMARIRALLRRMNPKGEEKSLISKDGIIMNLDAYEFSYNGKKINLTKREFELLYTLMENPNKVFTRDNLLDSLWGYDYDGDSRTVDTHIKRLRAKLPDVSERSWDIITIRGAGYKFIYDAKGEK